MRSVTLALTVVLAVSLASAFSALAERRVALVIGNGDYATLPDFNNAERDAADMAAKLRELGFEVILRINAGKREFARALTDFEGRLAGADASLVFYAGHGIQFEGINWLIPSDARVETEEDLTHEAVDFADILKRLQRASVPVNMVILDACRENPLPKRSRSRVLGLAAPPSIPRIAIVYSTSPGATAPDGVEGRNGVFTAALLTALRSPGATFDQVFKETSRRVRRLTNEKQTPSIVGSLTRDFYFSNGDDRASAARRATRSARAKAERARIERMQAQRQKQMRGRRLAMRAKPGRKPADRRQRRMPRPRSAAGSGGGSQSTTAPPPARSAPRQVPSPSSPARGLAPGRPASTKPAAEYQMSDFPWPPPEPSARMGLPREPFGDAADLAAVATLLIAPLRASGYWEYSFHRAPNGFALVTRLERINQDGSRVAESLRYRRPGDREPFSLSAYIRRLFFAPEGYYRLIVFVVTDRPFTATGAAIEEPEALRLLREGANVLPPEFKRMEFSAGHGIDALIYEFRKGARDTRAVLLLPGRLGPRVHLDKAGMSAAFGLRRN